LVKQSPLLSPTSPLLQTVVSTSDLKAMKSQNVILRLNKWSIVKTPGRIIVTAKTLNCIFKRTAKTYQFASNVG